MTWLGRARSLRASYLAALVPLAGLCELGAHHYFARRAPSFDGWAAAAAPAKRLHQPGDLLVVAPRWAEPLARRVLGDELMPMAELGRSETARYGTALELSILGARAPELQGWRELSRETSGKFELRRLENPKPMPTRFDFVDGLAPERVSVTLGAAATVCPWTERAPILAGGLGGHPTFPPQRFQCPAGSFFNVSVTMIADQDFLPRRCIWAHPPARGELSIRYRDVELAAVIAGHSGMYWIIERELTGAPITLRVRVSGEQVGEVVHVDGQGWAAFELGLGSHANTRADVEFAVSSPNYEHRHFCFEATTR
jgi:hypothetical protein